MGGYLQDNNPPKYGSDYGWVQRDCRQGLKINGIFCFVFILLIFLELVLERL